MKTVLYNFILVLFLFAGTKGIAGEPVFDIHKEKTISKVYLVNTDAGIDLTNKYGSVFVTTWNEDKIALDIVIKVRGENESKVIERLNKINIDINALKNLVSAKTVIESLSGGNISMEINYTVKIPKKGSVTLNNQYGNIIIDKIEERSNIECRYGNVSVEEFQGDNNLLKLKYCDKVTIGYMKSGTIDARYSNVSLTRSGNLNFKSDYTNLFVKEVNNLDYTSDYGDIIATSANSVNGTGNYLIIKFGTISGNLNIATRYSSIDVNNIAAKANNFNIDSAYTNVDLRYDPNYAFDYECIFRYGNLNAPGLNSQVKKESGEKSYFRGFYKSSGVNQISIASNYGNVKLTKN